MSRRSMHELHWLHRWKDEATIVLTQWDACYDELEANGITARLGDSKAEFVHQWIRDVFATRVAKGD